MASNLRLAKHFFGLAAAQGHQGASDRVSQLPEDDLAEPEREPPAATAHDFDVERRRLNAEAEAALRAMRGVTLGQEKEANAKREE